MAPLRIAVEFRHGSWLVAGKRGEVLGFLHEHGLLYVSADEPQFGDLRTIPYMPDVTGDTAYFRFHGRNRQNWFGSRVWGDETFLFRDRSNIYQFIRVLHSRLSCCWWNYLQSGNSMRLCSRLSKAGKRKNPIKYGNIFLSLASKE